MSTKKSSTTSQSPSPSYDQTHVDRVAAENYEKGIQEGQQQVWNGLANFIQARMNAYFEAGAFELAKECRHILLEIKPKLKQNS